MQVYRKKNDSASLILNIKYYNKTNSFVYNMLHMRLAYLGSDANTFDSLKLSNLKNILGEFTYKFNAENVINIDQNNLTESKFDSLENEFKLFKERILLNTFNEYNRKELSKLMNKDDSIVVNFETDNKYLILYCQLRNNQLNQYIFHSIKGLP